MVIVLSTLDAYYAYALHFNIHLIHSLIFYVIPSTLVLAFTYRPSYKRASSHSRSQTSFVLCGLV
jgi:hypothetical protein